MKCFLSFLIPLVVICKANVAFSITKRALIIGIGNYEDHTWNKINGDKDVLYVHQILKESGFSSIRTLVNSEATKNHIVKTFYDLSAECEANDIIYIHFSGHGQQMVDINGDENDGKDESWIPYDAYKKPCLKDMGEKHLSDDEIAVLLHKIKMRIGNCGKLLVVVDACHSGTATWSYGSEEDVIRGTNEVFYVSIPRTFSYISKSAPRSWITISACKDNQSNYELKGMNVGKLTYALYNITLSNKRFTNNEFKTMLHTFFIENAGSHYQTPVVNGLSSNISIQEILK